MAVQDIVRGLETFGSRIGEGLTAGKSRELAHEERLFWHGEGLRREKEKEVRAMGDYLTKEVIGEAFQRRQEEEVRERGFISTARQNAIQQLDSARDFIIANPTAFEDVPDMLSDINARRTGFLREDKTGNDILAMGGIDPVPPGFRERQAVEIEKLNVRAREEYEFKVKGKAPTAKQLKDKQFATITIDGKEITKSITDWEKVHDTEKRKDFNADKKLINAVTPMLDAWNRWAVTATGATKFEWGAAKPVAKPVVTPGTSLWRWGTSPNDTAKTDDWGQQ